MPKRLLFLDLETSGLYPEQGHVILSIGAIVNKFTKRDPIQEFYIEIMPTPGEWAVRSEQSMQVNGLTLSGLQENGVLFAEAVQRFVSFLTDNKIEAGNAFVIGQYPPFDFKFLQYYMRRPLEDINFPVGSNDVYDIRDLYSILVNRRLAPFLKHRSGANIAEALKVEPEPAIHNALEGARVVRRNYEKIFSLLNPEPVADGDDDDG